MMYELASKCAVGNFEWIIVYRSLAFRRDIWYGNKMIWIQNLAVASVRKYLKPCDSVRFHKELMQRRKRLKN